MNIPIRTYGSIARASYFMNKSGSLSDRIARTNDELPDGFTLYPKHSSKDVLTARSGDHYVIAHRGSDFKHSLTKDLKADLSVLFNRASYDKNLKARRSKTERIIKDIRSGQPESTFDLVGHSLGGNSVYETYKGSRVVREAVNKVNTFNIGSSALPDFGKSVSKPLRKTLDDNVTHHRVEGDPISANASVLHGEHVLQPSKKVKKPSKPIVEKVLDSMMSSTIPHVVELQKKTATSVANHSIDNFV